MTIAERIARDLGTPDLVDKLVALPANELTSLLLEVTRRRNRTPADLLAQYARDRAVHPTADDPRALLTVETHAFAAASAYTPVTLSPVSPLGLNAVLGDIDQNSSLAAVRNLEVLSDSTTMLALQAATQRKRGDVEVRLCAAARMLRMQPFDNPAFSRHFAIFALTTAARDRGNFAFEERALREHVRVYLTLLTRLATDGFRIADIRVELADTARDDSRVAAAEGAFDLRAEFPHVTFVINRARTHAIEYYRGTCFHIFARDVQGHMQQLCDGGSTDWTARLLSNAKERFFVSGIGSELLLRRFR